MLIQTIKLWEDRNDVELTTFLTMPDPFIPVLPKRPAIIVCPGGAYQTCPRHGTEGDPVAMMFAINGYQTFVLEYSVASKAPAGKTLFPAQLIDLGKAMLVIREHAQEWSIDTDRISIIGFSAGAHLCGMMATTWQQPLLQDYFHQDPSCFKPYTAMLIYPVADYGVQLDSEKRNPGPFSNMDPQTPVFGRKEPTQEQIQQYSPARHVSKDTPPLFIAVARDDAMVTPLNSLRLAEACLSADVPFELHMYEFGGHGFSLGYNLLRPWREDRELDCAAWKEEALRFLLRHHVPERIAAQADPFKEIMEWNLSPDK